MTLEFRWNTKLHHITERFIVKYNQLNICSLRSWIGKKQREMEMETKDLYTENYCLQADIEVKYQEKSNPNDCIEVWMKRKPMDLSKIIPHLMKHYTLSSKSYITKSRIQLHCATHSINHCPFFKRVNYGKSLRRQFSYFI